MKRAKEIGKVLPAPNKVRPSDILGIPLGRGYFGYARVLKHTFLEVLDRVSEGVLELSEIKKCKRKFYSEFYEPYDASPWIYLGKIKFESEEEQWGPPVWFGVPRKYISERGKDREVSLEETQGVMKQQLVHPDGIVDSIIEEFQLDIPQSERARLNLHPGINFVN